jgi:2-polyprenyl-3-methyl-5-hydroxy-6-metoxy-1,4-benzoquinol methylase
MDIVTMHGKAMEFERQLAERKRELREPEFWYPYGTLGNFDHFNALLTGENRFLLNLIGNDKTIVDIGCADGELAFFMESLGCKAQVIDYPPTNNNNLRGVKLLKETLLSSVEIHEVDLDSQFSLPERVYNLAFFLGILYHLKNPFYVLEALSKAARHCLISTRIAKFNRSTTGVEETTAKSSQNDRVDLKNIPVAYLLDDLEANNDATNYWIFSDAGLRRILKRTGWEILDYITVGNTTDSDPGSAEGDERAYCLVKSRRFV